jgi:putative methionine-R-sulfoxide reductase with GAF domain
MGADIIKIIIEKQPSWFFNVASVIMLVILIILGYWIFLGAKRYADAVGKENTLISLQQQLSDQKEITALYRNTSSQLASVVQNARIFINSLNEYRNDSDARLDKAHFLIQRIVEALASDIKSNGGERHRCGLWFENIDEGVLYLANGSAGFPDSYIGNRTLGIHESIAGRAYRKKQTIKIDNVENDSDWSPSDTPSSYKALICVPVGSWGVLTIDAKEPMDENAVLIGELYASIIEGILDEFSRLATSQDVQETHTQMS